MPSGPESPGSIRTRLGLTGRGWLFLGFGVAVIAIGLYQGWVAVVQFGALLALLPLAATVLTRNPHAGMSLERHLSARELASGDRLDVTVSVRGKFPRGRSLLLEDDAPPALGGPHRFALNGMSGHGISRSHYRLRVGARGIHRLGPMRIHVIDRFGMVHRVITAGLRDEVIVHPPVVPLDPYVLSGASVGTGSGHLGARGSATDDVIPREYHAGDEVRRIDWKASARTGNLMVRSEENPWRSAITIVIDMHESDHCGREPNSSVDVALSLAASVGGLALESGWDLTVRTTDDITLFAGSPMTGVPVERRELLLALATVPVSHSTVPSSSLGYSAQADGPGPLIMITGRLQAPTARLLARVGTLSPTRLLVAIAADQWAADGQGPTPLHDAPGSADALRLFALEGWRVVSLERAPRGPAGSAASIAQAWAGLSVAR